MKRIQVKVRLVKNKLGEFGQITSKELFEFAGKIIELQIKNTEEKK